MAKAIKTKVAHLTRLKPEERCPFVVARGVQVSITRGGAGGAAVNHVGQCGREPRIIRLSDYPVIS